MTLPGQPIADPITAPQPLVDPNLVPPGGPVNYHDPAVAAAVQSARQDEKRKLYSTIEKNKATIAAQNTRQAQLETELADLQAKVARVGQPELKGDAAVQARIDELSRQLTTTSQRNEELNRQIRQGQLDTYKERRLREVGPEVFVEMVGGGSEHEIEESILRARETFVSQQAFFYNQFQQRQVMPPGYVPPGYVPAGFQPQPQPGYYYPPQVQQPPAPTAPATFQPQPQFFEPPTAFVDAPPAATFIPAAPPPAPHFPNPAPQARGYYQSAMDAGRAAAGAPGIYTATAAMAPGFPSVAAGGSLPPQRQTSQHDLKSVTSEEAIRSGAYKENRAAVLASVRNTTVARR